MGVPCFYAYIVKNHTKIIKEFLSNNIDNFYMDCNSLIYDAVFELNKEDLQNKTNLDNYEKTLIQLIIKKIFNLINLVNPKQNCIIAFDGVAPLAKLNQQRIRRFKSSYENIIKNTITKTDNVSQWNRSCITPGTNFMKKLALKIETIKFNNNINNLNLIISTSNNEGEGEHKIFDYIRNNKNQHDKHETVIYGLDADLIMLSLNHIEYCNRIYLYRDTPSFINNIDRSLNPKKNYLMDITMLANTISLDFNDNKRIKDYIFICFLLGNDFMPHNPSLNLRTNGLDVILNYYKEYIVKKNIYLIINNEIQWKNVNILIKKLAEEEHDRIKEEYNIRNKFKINNSSKNKLTNIENNLLMLPMLDRKEELFINPLETKWSQRYYNALFNCSNIKLNNTLRNICTNYIEGLEWTFKYYTLGCYDWSWKYNYSYAPLLSDLTIFIPYFNTEYFPTINKNVVNCYTQLAYVLPADSLNLLPENIHKYILEKYNNYYTNHKFTWAFCKFFWESHIIFENIDINQIEKDIKCLTI